MSTRAIRAFRWLGLASIGILGAYQLPALAEDPTHGKQGYVDATGCEYRGGYGGTNLCSTVPDIDLDHSFPQGSTKNYAGFVARGTGSAYASLYCVSDFGTNIIAAVGIVKPGNVVACKAAPSDYAQFAVKSVCGPEPVCGTR